MKKYEKIRNFLINLDKEEIIILLYFLLEEKSKYTHKSMLSLLKELMNRTMKIIKNKEK